MNSLVSARECDVMILDLNSNRDSMQERIDSEGYPVPGSYSAVNHIYLNGVRFARGTLVVVGDRLGIRIREILATPGASG